MSTLPSVAFEYVVHGADAVEAWAIERAEVGLFEQVTKPLWLVARARYKL